MKYYILALFVGAVFKLYDDLYDNDLYDYFHLNREYTNETLKCLFILGFTVLSLKYLYFYIFFFLINATLYFIKKDEFGPYEFSGLFSSLILTPFLSWKTDYKSIFYILTNIVLCFIFESFKKFSCEYSYSKLYFRGICLFASILLLYLNRLKHFITQDVVIILLFIIGYLIPSVIFQYILIKNNKSIVNK